MRLKAVSVTVSRNCTADLVACLTMLSVSRLYDVDYRLIIESRTVGGIKIGRGNRSTRRKLTVVSLCPPEIPHDLVWDRDRCRDTACEV
jgi:hypothetical protein